MESLKSEEILFVITKDDIQFEAREKIGRTLSDLELEVAKKGLSAGLFFDIDTVYNTIFDEMIEK